MNPMSRLTSNAQETVRSRATSNSGLRLLLAIVALCSDASSVCAADSSDAPYTYELPIQGMDCCGFSVSDGDLYLFEYSSRQLHQVTRGGRLRPVEDVKGWFARDVAVVDSKPIYCSRGRMFRKIGGKIQVVPVKDTKALVSIAADDREIFLLDAAPKSTIIVLDARNGKERRRMKYDGRNPVDLAVGDEHLWVLDKGDRCIHRVDKKTGKTSLRFQAGPGIARHTQGLLFRDGHLYLHEGDYSRLRRVEWEQDGPAVWSWSNSVRMTFVQESSNVHDRNTSNVVFNVPVPPSRPTQSVSKLRWSQRPTRLYDDDFGQAIALFNNIRVAPRSRHVLSYTVDVQLRAVQYDPPEIPLSSLESIDPKIRRTYLASNRLYRMDDPGVKAAAREARRNGKASDPTDVRSLIENIADYMVGKMSYQLDDSWKDAATVVEGGKGSCSEYSFLFSALCRLNKIPTRLVGGLQIGDYGKAHETRGFHRWTEVFFPEIGWIPVDVTKIDGAEGSLDYEFLFGTPGYLIVLSQGDFDEDALGMTYYIRRSYRGGKRERKNYVKIEPLPDADDGPVVTIRK